MVLAVILLFSIKLCRYFATELGNNQTIYLLEAERVLGGDVPYGPHLVESNPPIIIFLNVLPVLLAKIFSGAAGLKAMHLASIAWLRALVVAMLMGSALWCTAILRRSATWKNSAAMNSFVLVLFGGAMLFAEMMVGHPDVFAEREQMAAILMMPYLLAVSLSALQSLSMAERCALGAAAGLALWLKPQQVLVVIALELCMAVMQRSLRRVRAPEFLSLIGTCILLLLVVCFATPQFFRDTFPLLMDTYWGLSTYSTLYLATHNSGLVYYMLFLLAAVALLHRKLHHAAPIYALTACCLGAYIAYCVQHTNWFYHGLPFQILLRVVLILILLDLSSPLLEGVMCTQKWFFAGPLIVALLLAALAARDVRQYFTARRQAQSSIEQYLQTVPEGTTVYLLSVNLNGAQQSYQHGQRWGSRYVHLWWLAAIEKTIDGPPPPDAPFKKLSPQRFQTISDQLRAQIAEDMNYFQPSIVMVDRCPLAENCDFYLNDHFDELAWFLQSPQFQSAWSHYALQRGVSGYDIYRRTQ